MTNDRFPVRPSMAADDIRRAERMGLIDGVDTYLQPLNMTDVAGGGDDG